MAVIKYTIRLRILTQFLFAYWHKITVYYAYHGIKGNKNHPDAFLRNLPYLGIAGVGLGSFIFHATMKNYTQWCDDLSMLIATATVLHRVYTFDKSLSTTAIAGVGITAFMTIFSTWHCYMDEITMHSILFGTWILITQLLLQEGDWVQERDGFKREIGSKRETGSTREFEEGPKLILTGVMIAIIGLKTRMVIQERIKDPAVCAEVMKLCTWGSSKNPLSPITFSFSDLDSHLRNRIRHLEHWQPDLRLFDYLQAQYWHALVFPLWAPWLVAHFYWGRCLYL